VVVSGVALTDLQIRKLVPRPRERFEVWDARLPGFGVRIAPTGTKSFILVYRHKGRPRRMTLGRYPVLSLADARKRAIEALAGLARGADPQSQKMIAQTSTRFDDVVRLFVGTYCRQHNRESTRRETERLLQARFVSRWGARDLSEISKADVLKILDEALHHGTPSAANHALATIRLLFNWCVDRGLLDTNPCSRLKMPAKAVSRDRVLTDAEILQIWSAAKAIGYPFGTIAQLLLLTAQRRNEVVSLRWSDLDLEAAQWTIPGQLTKNGIAHVVPLVPVAIEILKRVPRIDEQLIFPSQGGKRPTFSGFSKSKERLTELACVQEFTLHDLRRTAATRLAGLGVAPHVIERLLNHVTGVLGGVAGVYNRFKYRDEVREALMLWAEYIRRLENHDPSADNQPLHSGALQSVRAITAAPN
jgi:integrase